MITTDPDTGPIERSELVKGYDVSKGEYVLPTDKEIKSVKLETTKTIEIERFVPGDDIDRLLGQSLLSRARWQDGPGGFRGHPYRHGHARRKSGGLLRQVRAGRLPTQPRVRTAPAKTYVSTLRMFPEKTRRSHRSARLLLGPRPSSSFPLHGRPVQLARLVVSDRARFPGLEPPPPAMISEMRLWRKRKREAVVPLLGRRPLLFSIGIRTSGEDPDAAFAIVVSEPATRAVTWP